MIHRADPGFWECYQELPPDVQRLADHAFDLLKTNLRHPSLHFKKVGRFRSVRVGRKYRCLGVDSAEGITWFWIGPHPEYDRLIGW